ncbi:MULTISPECIES: phospho-N-acetylmuramoyl-pentapeptide-transferase [unclassified Sedimentibacter]|uniref:phospho-N-acetylmuramoyl-pentapeptide- transferase n=1 Tax=unclassified Sedimentibacter TaxID=2649220 RepID=UPI0027DF3515|nr:phospho-N-acetylmuramoyl-pentapeptide-transferase [Sedimentibacter sp. MB35-C1]WMJ75943.1 phospho-N-acetylmuramoyl-pentapeptide-transferase [Sedimentibacter sp. MB35-C1]
MIQYFTFSLLFTALFLKVFIDKLSKTSFFKRTENIDSNKKSCIQELHKHKAATPTMGGVAINLTLFISTVAYSASTSRIIWSNFFLLLFGLMGFVDDYIKVKKKRDGITPKEKLAGLIIIGVIITIYLILSGQINTQIMFPLISNSIEINTYLYGVFTVFLIVLASNSVNITDGVDGLALGICSIVFVFIGICAYQLRDDKVLFGAIIMEGACLGTLFFNRYPAKIFMGDTGSLFLGGSIAVFLIELNIPLWIFIVLCVCIFETISVIIQLFSLKYFNKRVFKIAPFHHHLEKSGWKESTITLTFCIITFAACFIAYLGFGA